MGVSSSIKRGHLSPFPVQAPSCQDAALVQSKCCVVSLCTRRLNMNSVFQLTMFCSSWTQSVHVFIGGGRGFQNKTFRLSKWDQSFRCCFQRKNGQFLNSKTWNGERRLLNPPDFKRQLKTIKLSSLKYCVSHLKHYLLLVSGLLKKITATYEWVGTWLSLFCMEIHA